jgi:GT2 family glycosyltransferase
MSDLSDVSILLKTFLRDDKLFNSIAAIRRNMSEVQMIIVDDGEMTKEKDEIYVDLVNTGHKVICLPFDSGFGTKSNIGAEALVRPFLLISSDDFDHNPLSVEVGIRKMLAVLDRSPELSIVSGRLVGRRPYEFYLSVIGSEVYEVPIAQVLNKTDHSHPDYKSCDLTMNYNLIRREVFDKVRHDDGVKIGDGDHGSFFLDVKQAGFKVGYVPGVFISHQGGLDSARYNQYRRRACNPERSCFVKRGITKYVLGNGQVDYEKEKQ